MKRPAGRLSWALATWFGCGFAPIAPGTAGTLGAVPLYLVVARFGPQALWLAIAVVTGAGIWAASRVARELRVKDPQLVVIDEVAGLLVTMLPVSHVSWSALVAGVLLFRFFDIVKPWPVRWLEKLPGGWGIVLDDVAAGIMGAAVMGVLGAVRVIP
jgi:phosphatidylglycerophosphatase A